MKQDYASLGERLKGCMILF